MSELKTPKIAGRGVASAGSLSRFFFALSLALGAILSGSFVFLGVAFVLGLLAIQVWKGTLQGAVRAGLYVLPLAIFIFVLHLFTHSGEPLFKLSFISATAEGARAGLLYGLKLFIYAASGYIIFAIVDPFNLIVPFERLARKFGPAGRFVSGLAIAFFLALRFLPELSNQGKNTLIALRARGLDFRGNLFHKLKVMLFVAAPLFVSGFKRADLAALALDIKGYGTRYLSAVFAPLRPNAVSLMVVLAGMAVVIAGIKT